MSLFKKIFKYIWPQVRKQKTLFWGLIFCWSARIILSAIIKPFYFKRIIDTLSLDIASRANSNIFTFVYLTIGVTIIAIVFARLARLQFYYFMPKVIKDLRDFAFEKVLAHSPTFFANTFAGSLVTKSRRFANAFERMFEIFLYNFLNFVIIMSGVIIVLAHESVLVMLVFISFVTLNLLSILVFIRKKMEYDILESEQDSKISGRLADVFGNILSVKFFSGRKKEIKDFEEHTNEGVRRATKAYLYGGRIEVSQSFLVSLVQGITIYIMIVLWIRGELSTGTVVMVQLYMTIVGDMLWEMSGALTSFMKSMGDMKEMIDILEVTPDILDPINPEEISVKQGKVVFDSVSFKYPSGASVLNDFNLVIEPGERVGVVGHSGAGKSTITRLILRANDVSSGSVTIDGQDIRNITQDDLHNVVSYVPQEPSLFHRPIKENIAYGKFSYTDEEIISVAKKAHAHEFISQLSYGYDTLVGERGVKLSGGERQRVAIARAMLKDAPILILDEATSSLDSVSESYIQDAFGELMKGKTTLVIAHRLSTIQKMDRIIVLDKGKIVEEGTHKELLAKGGIYADLWEHQTGGFLE
jgi:ATP-binding cassette subfamily B protein